MEYPQLQTRTLADCAKLYVRNAIEWLFYTHNSKTSIRIRSRVECVDQRNSPMHEFELDPSLSHTSSLSPLSRCRVWSVERFVLFYFGAGPVITSRAAFGARSAHTISAAHCVTQFTYLWPNGGGGAQRSHNKTHTPHHHQHTAQAFRIPQQFPPSSDCILYLAGTARSKKRTHTGQILNTRAPRTHTHTGECTHTHTQESLLLLLLVCVHRRDKICANVFGVLRFYNRSFPFAFTLASYLTHTHTYIYILCARTCFYSIQSM